MRTHIVFLTFVFFSSVAFPKIEVLFHPADPTLEKIGQWLQEAKSTVDIAMYEMDASLKSPFIVALASDSVQARLKSKQLSIRLIYEGYDSPQGNAKKMAQLEQLGIDVRFLTSSKAVHHKFAVFDSALENSRVVSGSANWSLGSFNAYDENILFFDREAVVTTAFANEFELLWSHSTEFGNSFSYNTKPLPSVDPSNTESIFFNSPKHLLKDPSAEHDLPLQIIAQINSAQKDLLIATTRARIIPVLEALRAAAERGVKIRILLGQDDYHDLANRSQWLLIPSNIELRVKFYNLVPGNFMRYQMHNKFMIIDHEKVLTGSFNWSNASQTDNIENLILLSGSSAAEILPDFVNRFELLWKNGRDGLLQFENELRTDQENQILPACAFNPISLSYAEINQILQLAPKCGHATGR